MCYLCNFNSYNSKGKTYLPPYFHFNRSLFFLIRLFLWIHFAFSSNTRQINEMYTGVYSAADKKNMDDQQ